MAGRSCRFAQGGCLLAHAGLGQEHLDVLLRWEAPAAAGEASGLLCVPARFHDLDGQLYQQFCAAKVLLKQTPEQAESREQLREMLAARKSGGIIFTTSKWTQLAKLVEASASKRRWRGVPVGDR